MKKTIGALILGALLALPGAVSAYCIDYCDYGYGYGYQDNCYCSGQGGFYRDPVMYSYSPAYGYGGAGYDQYGNYGYIPPTYSYPSYPPSYSYPTYTQPSYSYPQYYYPQYTYPYLNNTNTNTYTNNNINFNNVVNNNNPSVIAAIFGW